MTEITELTAAVRQLTQAMVRTGGRGDGGEPIDIDIESFEESLEKLNNEAIKAGKGIKKAGSMASSGMGDLTSASGSLFSSFVSGKADYNSAVKSISSGALGLKKVLGGLSRFAFPKLDKTMKVASLSFPKITAGLGLLGGAASGAVTALSGIVGFLVGQLTQSYDAFQKVAEAGGTFGGSLMELKMAASSTGLTVEEFGNYVKGANKQLAAFGGSVTRGAKMTASLAANITQSDLLGQFKALGMSQQAIVEASGAYLKVQADGMRIDKFSAMAADQQANETLKYVKSLKLLGELTGESIDEQMKKRQELRSIAMFRRALDEMGPNTRANMENAAGVFQSISKEAGQYFRELVAEGKPLTEITALMAQRFPGMGNAMGEVINTIRTQGEALSKDDSAKMVIDAIGRNREQLLADSKAQDAFLRASGMSGADAMITAFSDTTVALKDFVIKTQGELTTELMNSMKPTDEAAMKAAENMVKISAMFKQLLDQLLLSPGFVTALEELSKVLADDVVPRMKDLIRKITKFIGDDTGEVMFDENVKEFKEGGDFRFEDVRDMEIDIAKAVKAGVDDDKLREMFEQWQKAQAELSISESLSKAARDIFSWDFWAKDWDEVNKKRKELGFADGGISKGPKSGYNAELHGTEAVVPLPDGKNIPVKMDTSDLVAAISRLEDKLEKISRNTAETNEQMQRL